MSEFVSDLKKIKERARAHMEKGAVTGGYKADLKAVIKVLERDAGDRDRLRPALQTTLLHGLRH